MTNASPVQESAPAPAPDGAAIAHWRQGAQRLLIGGFLGAQITGVLAVIVFAVLAGRTGAVSAAVGVVVVVLYRVLGHQVMVAGIGSGRSRQWAMLMASVVVRMAALLALVALWLGLPSEVTARFDGTALALGVLAGEVGWLAALLITSARSRIPVYDPAPTLAPEAGGAR